MTAIKSRKEPTAERGNLEKMLRSHHWTVSLI